MFPKLAGRLDIASVRMPSRYRDRPNARTPAGPHPFACLQTYTFASLLARMYADMHARSLGTTCTPPPRSLPLSHIPMYVYSVQPVAAHIINIIIR